MIRAVTVYETKGKQFPTLKKAVEHREGLIEAFLRQTPGYSEMRARDTIPFVQSIIDRRRELMDLLNYETTVEED